MEATGDLQHDDRPCAPRARELLAGAGERRCLRVRAGGAADVKGEESAPADTFFGCDDGELLHHDAAHGADQISGIPPGAVRHRSLPAGPGRRAGSERRPRLHATGLQPP